MGLELFHRFETSQLGVGGPNPLLSARCDLPLRRRLQLMGRGTVHHCPPLLLPDERRQEVGGAVFAVHDRRDVMRRHSVFAHARRQLDLFGKR